MATQIPTKLSDLFGFNPITNPAGGFNIAKTTPATLIKNVPAPAFPVAPTLPPSPTIAALYNKPSAPVAPAAPVAPVIAQPPVIQPPVGPTGGAGGPTGSTGPTGPTGAAINPAFLNADGSFKSPDQIAAEVGGTLKAAHSVGDVGALALQQFGGNGGTTADATAAARQITNTRNDIAVGQTDPYKVASQSGIAYTPAELKAIESAYAGVYDPALDTALAKVTDKQNADKAAADKQSQLDQIAAQGEQTRKTQAAAPYTLGTNDVRYGADGQPIAVGGGNSAPATYVAGQDPTADAYVKGFQAGTYKASDIPDAYKSVVAQGVAQASADGAPLSKASTDAIGIINQLQTLDLSTLSGTGVVGALEHPSSLFPGTAVQKTQNLAKQLQGTISLANRQQLKGSGAISDFEFRVLGEAATALGLDSNGRTNLSPEDFKQQLNNLELKLQVGPTQLTDDEIQYLASPAGGSFTPDDIRSYSQQQSFNSVGNTKASTGTGNRPQRNNNPGNVKAGGLSDSLATGKDDQGHLIFPDAATGFKALTADLTAKINGSSKYLPTNPTIAQLGKVYAEDPNWPKKVAMMLGVGVDTPTKSVPLDKLVKAVATQEGFYA